MLTENGTPTRLSQLRYTQGECWLLAFEIGRLTGCPLTALVFRDADGVYCDWIHVTVDLGRETLLDVMGSHSRDKLMADWTRRAREPLSFRELGRPATLDDLLDSLNDTMQGLIVTRQDEEDARAVARALAATHCGSAKV